MKKMAITQLNPRTVHLAGPITVVNDIAAGEAITPGNLIELYRDSGGELKWRKHASATEITSCAVALEQTEMNLGIDDAYAADDLVKAGFLAPGSVFYGLIPSGQNIQYAELLQSNGDGNMKAATATTAAANVGKFQSLDEPGSVVESTRVRVQVIQ